MCISTCCLILTFFRFLVFRSLWSCWNCSLVNTCWMLVLVLAAVASTWPKSVTFLLHVWMSLSVIICSNKSLRSYNWRKVGDIVEEGTPPPQPTRGSEGALWATPAGSGTESRPQSPFQHFLSVTEMTERCKWKENAYFCLIWWQWQTD